MCRASSATPGMVDDAGTEGERERAWRWMHKQKAGSVTDLKPPRWDLRYFVMDGSELRYYQEEMSTTPRGTIPLASITDVSAVRLECDRLPHKVDPLCHSMGVRLKWKAKRSLALARNARVDLFLLCGVRCFFNEELDGEIEKGRGQWIEKGGQWTEKERKKKEERKRRKRAE